MKNKIRASLVSAALLPTLLLAKGDRPAEKPNFIFIVADDMGYGDIGCFGNKEIRTPNLDHMATDGMVLRNFHTNGAASTPTRVGFLTGRYQQRAGMEGVLLTWNEQHKISGMQPEEITFAEILKEHDYKTALYGKWHVGSADKYNPVNQGFDEFIGFKSGNVDYQNYRDTSGDEDWWDGLELKGDTGYATELINKYSVDYINKNKDNPFCLYVAHACPHFPYMGPNDEAYRVPNNLKQHQGSRKDRDVAYKEMIENMDEGIGHILEALKKNGIEQKTYVIFFSDNGPTGPGSSGPFRGKKGTLFEGGHRVPAIFYRPGTIAPGQECQQPVMAMDLFPTMMHWAGINYKPKDKKLDGMNVAGILQGKQLPERPLFWRNGIGKAVSDGGYKLVIEKQGKDGNINVNKYLFNIKDDPKEQINLYESTPKEVARLESLLLKWEKDVDSETKEQL